MSKKLSQKTANIDLGNVGSKPAGTGVIDGQSPPPLGSPLRRPSTGVGLVMKAITGNDDATKKLEEAEAKLAQYQDSSLTLKLDATLIRPSHWANRDEAEWSSESFREFKAEIQSAGGNVQPIKVRRIVGVIDGQSPAYEIVYGHRRHRACLESELPVLALVEDSMSDLALFTEMDRENRGRKNLSAWEQGKMYADAIAQGLFRSIRHLSDELGVNQSDASRAVQLAKLPADVINAFPSRLDLQVRWAKPLSDVLQRDPEGVLTKARALAKEKGRHKASEVFWKLTGEGGPTGPAPVAIAVGGKRLAQISKGSKGRALIEFEPGVLDDGRHEALAKLIEKFLAGS